MAAGGVGDLPRSGLVRGAGPIVRLGTHATGQTTTAPRSCTSEPGGSGFIETKVRTDATVGLLAGYFRELGSGMR